MSDTPPKELPPQLSHRRLFLLPGALLAFLAGLPWILEGLERFWTSDHLTHLRESIETGITLLLGAWVMTLIQREQSVGREHLKELERLSLTDPLTGLGNRRALERDLDLRLARSRRLGEPVALLYLDVDALKELNDRYGHAVGDETLRSLSAVLRASSRYGTDTAYRVGGDEYVMVLAADRPGAEAIAGRIALNFPERSPHGSKVSMGVVIWDGKATFAQLLDEADSRMYRQKRPGMMVQWS